MNSQPKQVEDVLLDVRRAYRFVHDYQRWMLDAAKYIGAQLGLMYAGGWPKFSDPAPRRGSGSLDCWAWDWLNLIHYDFHFQRALSTGGAIHFSILLISDTGCFTPGKDPTDDPIASTLLPVETSQSAVAFIMSAGVWPHPAYMESNEGMRKFVESKGKLPPEHKAAGVVSKYCSVACLATEESTNALIDDLVALASVSGIPLTRVAPKHH